EAAGTPLVSTTLIPDGEEAPLNDAQEIFQRYGNELAAVIDGGACSLAPTTVIDLTGPMPEVVRQGQGDLAAAGLDWSRPPMSDLIPMLAVYAIHDTSSIS